MERAQSAQFYAPSKASIKEFRLRMESVLTRGSINIFHPVYPSKYIRPTGVLKYFSVKIYVVGIVGRNKAKNSSG